MRKTIKNQILSRIYGRGRGWCFTANDFTVDFNRNEVTVALHTLAKNNIIRRISTGLYDYPLYSSILEKYVAPDMEQAALALARKFSWRIQPTGETALNYLGLSNQVSSKYTYFSDGPSKAYNLDGQEIKFKHHTFKEASISNSNANLTIQAIKHTGENNITADFKLNLASRFSKEEWLKIKKSTAKATGWVYEIITEISENKND
ncbi:MAG: DUF6088 family protein [Alphaproteobacteria bacterium]